MNKTININLGGFFFHIDERAFQKLRRYLDAISKSLSDDPQGKNEIIADIEARISELLSEKITDEKQVVNENDIDDVITIMGQPEDYADAEESYNDVSYSYQRNNSIGKKLFRDGEDKFLGGVAAGIAHYFNVDTIWIRLVFLVTTLAGLGSGVLAYIILWILLPEAKTTAEKLQMEGEAVNIDNIERKIREEFSNVSETVKQAANQASDKLKDGANLASEKLKSTANEFSEKMKQKSKKNNGIQDFLDTLGKIIMAIFKVVGKFIGVILILFSTAGILFSIFGAFSVGSLEFLNIDGQFLPPFFFGSMFPRWLLTTFLFLAFVIPFLILFVLGLRILSRSVRKLHKTTSLTLLGLWLIAAFGLGFAGIEFATTHAIDGINISKNNLTLVANDTLTLKVWNDDTVFYKNNLNRHRNYREQIIEEVAGKIKVYSNDVAIDVEMSSTDTSYFTVQKISTGRNRRAAKKNSKAIEYHFEVVDNTLIFDAFYISDYQNLFKDEEIKVTLYLAKGVCIFFDNSSKNFLSDVDNTTNTYDREMAKHYFLMTEEGLHSPVLKALKDSEKKEN
ncbi:PspC domain-containing protein [Polaribacter sp.]|nr:PspC domain-containing protein [Polaribacter sp.]MDC0087192.1 PspC domain-containing protein [Polaribacter sp.]